MADMFIWIVNGGLKRRQQPRPRPEAFAAYVGPLVFTNRPSPEQAVRLGQFALQFLH